LPAIARALLELPNASQLPNVPSYRHDEVSGSQDDRDPRVEEESSPVCLTFANTVPRNEERRALARRRISRIKAAGPAIRIFHGVFIAFRGHSGLGKIYIGAAVASRLAPPPLEGVHLALSRMHAPRLDPARSRFALCYLSAAPP